jgi:REP element-mobilizing transposase RayT
MVLNPLGKIADCFWREIPLHCGNVVLDAFVIMPNHVHGIIFIIDDPVTEQSVATLHATSLRCEPVENSEYFSDISPKKGSLSTIIRSVKSAVTRKIHQDLAPSFAWQPRYYDHIIRAERDLENLRWYITLNPGNWRDCAQCIPSEGLTNA